MQQSAPTRQAIAEDPKRAPLFQTTGKKMTKFANVRTGAKRDVPVFDRRNELSELLDELDDASDVDDAPISTRLTSPEEREAARAVVELKRVAQAASIRKKSLEIARRQAIGDPGCAANDNEDFPLLAVLRRDGLREQIDAVMEYRRLVALAEAQPLQGVSHSGGDGLWAVFRSDRMRGEEEVEAAAAAGFEGAVVPGGELKYKGVRRSRGAISVDSDSSQARRSAIADSDNGVPRTQTLARPFNVDTLAAHVDARVKLPAIKTALGPLMQTLDDAALGGKTFSEIGRLEGFEVKPDVAGKALVMRGLRTLVGILGEFAEHERHRAALARENVKAARAAL
ncbi:MAG TPA: hypothetical protein VE079_07430 [Ensifer sp.]|nr:hypothetical protein [Ensifer sp.]